MPQRERVTKVFSVMREDGKVIRLVEACSVADVKEYILRVTGIYEIKVASALTVARAGLETEKAGE